MRHTITTTIINAPTGTPASEDGVMMMVIKGVAASTGTTALVLDTAYLGNKLADFTTGLGITADYDYINNLAVYQQISEFYAEAGDGAKLWLVVTGTATAFNTYVATDTFKNLVRGTANGDQTNRAKMLGLCYNPPTAQQSASDFPSDVLTVINTLQTTQTSLFAEGFSFSALVDAYNMSSTATPSTIQSVATKNAPSISVVITGSKPNGVASVGAALGRFARISTGHGFGAVEDGQVTISKAYLTNGTTVPVLGTTITQGTNLTAGHTYIVINGKVTYNGNDYSVGESFLVIAGTLGFTGTNTTVLDTVTTGAVVVGTTYQVLYGTVTYNGFTYAVGSRFTAVTGQTSFTGGVVFVYNSTDAAKLYPADVNALGDKQYMFLRTWFGQGGLYWNDGATADLATKPLSTQEFNRVANKLSANLLTFLTQLMGKNIPIDSKTNKAAQSFVSAKQEDFNRIYIEPMVNSGDISSGSLFLEGIKNGASSINWNYTLTINGTPITGSINGTVQFV